MTELSPLSGLRVVVAHLGEVQNPRWWASSFTTETGIDFASYNFTKSHVSAAVAGATVAARRVHDVRIGRKGTRHLFRLEGGLERAIHREILEADQSELHALVETPNGALDHLRRLATQTVEAPEGPVQIGRFGDEEKSQAIADLAAHYLSGFERGLVVLPYFSGAK